MKRDGGHALVELLVASSCTGLLAAGVLGLMVNSAGIVRDRMSRLDAAMRVDRCAHELARDLRRAGRGLESSGPLRGAAGLVGVIEPAAGGVGVMLALGPPIEVDELVPGTYRIEYVGALVPGTRVAAVGLADTAPAIPLATLVRSARVASEKIVEVGWDASQLRILEQHGPVRALLPLSLRAYETRLRAPGIELRRRDDGGSWQPVAGGLANIEISFGLATAAADHRPLSTATSLVLPADISIARIDCVADTGITAVRAVQWAAIGQR